MFQALKCPCLSLHNEDFCISVLMKSFSQRLIGHFSMKSDVVAEFVKTVYKIIIAMLNSNIVFLLNIVQINNKISALFFFFSQYLD